MSEFLLFVVVGFCAQLVDGAIGMAYGIVSTSLMLSMGIAPAQASAVVHAAEVFTTAASGLSHAYFRNIDWRLLARLAPAGMIGGVLGALALVSFDAGKVQFWVSLYLAAIGCYIIFKAFRPLWPRDVRDAVVPVVGFFGGFMDASGGGGWGPIVTSSLIGRGHTPRKVIGSVNAAEFLVTVCVSASFVFSLGFATVAPAFGLIIGGLLAAPFGGYLVSRIPIRPMMFLIGLVIVTLSVFRLLS